MSDKEQIEPQIDSDSSVIKKIREEYKTVVEALKQKEGKIKEYEEKIREFETAKLSEEEKTRQELEQLKARISELEPVKERLEKTEQAAKELYESALNKIPEEKRDVVRTLTQKESFVESFRAIELVRESFLKDIKFAKTEPDEPKIVSISEQPKSIAEDFRAINLKEAISSRLSSFEVEQAKKMKRLMETVD